MATYRNIYLKSKLPKFRGKELLYYTDEVILNAETNPKLRSSYDRTKDIYLNCDCDAAKYAAIMKAKPSVKANNTMNTITHGKRCKRC